MKIAIIAHNKFPIAQPYAGGLEMITHLLVKGLTEKGHLVHLYACRGSDKQFTYQNLEEFGEIPKECLEHFSKESNCNESFIEEFSSYAALMNKLKSEEYDIVHNHAHHFHSVVLGNFFNGVYITTFHTPPFTPLQIALHTIRNQYNQHFTMVSNNLGEDYKPFISEYEVVYNGIDLSAWSMLEKPKSNYWLWYGRICPEKGLEYAIQIAIKTNIPLIISGPISNHDYYEQLIKLHLSNNLINYYGHLEQEELLPIVQNAKATLFTSVWNEPYGLVIAESLACGTPVVAFEKGAAPDILNEKTGVLIDEDMEMINDSFINKVESIDRKECRKRAEEFCNYRLMVEAYEKLYKKWL